jgi:hypothetical protein
MLEDIDTSHVDVSCRKTHMLDSLIYFFEYSSIGMTLYVALEKHLKESLL